MKYCIPITFFCRFFFAFTFCVSLCHAQNKSEKILTLKALIEDSLKSYPSILAKQANQGAANSELIAAKLRFLPNISVNSLRNQTTYDGGSPANLPATSFTISQPIFMGGGLLAGFDKADARLSAADFSLLETRDDVSRRIVNSYAEWLKAHLKVIALVENVKLHENFSTLITNRFTAGVSSGADRDLGVSRLYQARAELDAQISIQRTALSAISELVGYSVTDADLASSISRPIQPPPRSDGIFKAIHNSAALRRAKFDVEASEAEAREVRAQAIPQLHLQAQRQIGNAYLPGSPGYSMVGLVVQYASGGGLSSFAASSAAFDRAKGAAFQVDALKRDLIERLNADYNEYEFSGLRVKSLLASTNLAGDIGASYDRQYLVGRKSWIDLMNSMREKTQNKSALADAQGSLLAASYRLYIHINGSSSLDEFARAAQLNTSN